MKKWEKPILTYWTDGACSGNPGPGGFGIIKLSKLYNADYSILGYQLYSYSERHQNTTNNRMELMAVIQALKMAKEDTRYRYVIYSDSAYVVNMCNDWIWKWAQNNWTRAKGKPIENLNLVKELYSLLNLKIDYEIKKCPGHAGILENELVDAIAAQNHKKLDKLIKDNNIEVVII